MSRPLSPTLACSLADGSYATRASLNPNRDAADRAGASSRSAFDIDNAAIFNGKTGLGTTTNFGFCAFGKSTSRQSECVIAVRGTVTPSDWLTDGRMAGARGPNGFVVHRGFNSLSQAIYPQIEKALQGRNPSTIHLVGHSLGGATATIIADALQGIAQIKLYTFGAPRAGFADHAAYLTNAIKPENIYRVYHDTDPVPMLPIFPYGHCPAGDSGLLIKGSGMIIWPGAHKLGQYQNHCAASWSSMKTINHRRFSLETVDDVLQEAGALPGGYLSSLLMRLIVKALGMILDSAGVVVGLTLLGAATIADQIVYALMQSASIVSTSAETMQNLVRQIMRFLGLSIQGTVNVTKSFLEWLVEKLIRTMVSLARQATNTFNT